MSTQQLQPKQCTPPRPIKTKKRLVCGSIVVVAKVPTPGVSKTRLNSLLGAEGSKNLATAMLADVLTTLSDANFSAAPDENPNDLVVIVDRILLYAPATRTGKQQMQELCQHHKIPLQQVGGVWKPNAWTLVPMDHMPSQRHRQRPPIQRNKFSASEKEKEMLKSSQLGGLLENALQRARQRQRNPGPVVFLGMDSPQIPLDEIAYALGHPEEARLCPAADGGYGLLSVPHRDHQPHYDCNAMGSVFDGVRWSSPLTAVSQIKALTDQRIPVTLGRLMYDIDEPRDVMALVERLNEQLELKPENVAIGDNPHGEAGGTVDTSRTYLCHVPIPNTQSTDKAAGTGAIRGILKSAHGRRGSGDVLVRNTSYTPTVEFPCPWTLRALNRMGLWPLGDGALTKRSSDSPLSILTKESSAIAASPKFDPSAVTIVSETPSAKRAERHSSRHSRPHKQHPDLVSVEQVMLESERDYASVNFLRDTSMYSL